MGAVCLMTGGAFSIYDIFRIFVCYILFLMKKKTVIFLSCVILVMTAVIALGVYYLYSTPHSDETAAAGHPQEQLSAEPVQDEPAVSDAASADSVSADSVSDAVSVPTETPKLSPDTTPEFKVKNSGTGKMNTLRQRQDNKLELLDHNGKSLWVREFPGRIVGEPAQIDIYNNLKIQFLIAQGNKLHLIDRLGREVKAFPVTLPAEAVSGPADVKSGNIVYWKIETAKGTVYFDKKTKGIIKDLPKE